MGRGTASIETLRPQTIPVTGIRTWESYRPISEEAAHLAFAERPALNAMVIAEWRSTLLDPATGPWVLLTNGTVADPWTPVNVYDGHSWIENDPFRNSKQCRTLMRWFPQKVAAGVCVHLVFVLPALPPQRATQPSTVPCVAGRARGSPMAAGVAAAAPR